MGMDIMDIMGIMGTRHGEPIKSSEAYMLGVYVACMGGRHKPWDSSLIVPTLKVNKDKGLGPQANFFIIS